MRVMLVVTLMPPHSVRASKRWIGCTATAVRIDIRLKAIVSAAIVGEQRFLIICNSGNSFVVYLRGN